MNPQDAGLGSSLQGGLNRIQNTGSGLALQGSPNTIQLTGNPQNAGLSGSQPGSSAASTGGNPFASQEAATNQLVSLDRAILAQEQANAPGTPISLNLNNLRSAAQSQSSGSVNALYNQQLNQYLQNEASNAQAAQAGNTLNINTERNTLSNTLASNTLQQQQAASTNALQQGNINVQQQNYELQSGNAQNAKLQALTSGLGSGGIEGSGLGQQQIYEAENAKNAADAAQRGQFQFQRDTGNLSTEDTFQQLALSSQQATTGEGLQEQQTNFNLNDYLRQAANNDAVYRNQLNAWQQEAQSAATWNTLGSLIQNAISSSGVSGKNLAATQQAYAPYAQTISAPGQLNPLDYLNNNISQTI